MPSTESMVHILHVVQNHAQLRVRTAKQASTASRQVAATACQCDLCLAGRRWIRASEELAARPRRR